MSAYCNKYLTRVNRSFSGSYRHVWCIGHKGCALHDGLSYSADLNSELQKKIDSSSIYSAWWQTKSKRGLHNFVIDCGLYLGVHWFSAVSFVLFFSFFFVTSWQKYSTNVAKHVQFENQWPLDQFQEYWQATEIDMSKMQLPYFLINWVKIINPQTLLEETWTRWTAPDQLQWNQGNWPFYSNYLDENAP